LILQSRIIHAGKRVSNIALGFARLEMVWCLDGTSVGKKSYTILHGWHPLSTGAGFLPSTVLLTMNTICIIQFATREIVITNRNQPSVKRSGQPNIWALPWKTTWFFHPLEHVGTFKVQSYAKNYPRFPGLLKSIAQLPATKAFSDTFWSLVASVNDFLVGNLVQGP
jgi:hypothetical protein